MPVEPINPLNFKNQQEWRQWLKENYFTSGAVWVVLRKNNSKAVGLTYQQALDEALCFGWIDGLMRSQDTMTFLQRFTPRRRGSIWSKKNRDRVAKLIEAGFMTEAGLKAVEEAKKSGKWDEAYSSREVKIPEDLLLALEGTPSAYTEFMSSPDSRKLQWVYWLNEAKKSETRLRRIQRILEHNTKPI